MTSKLKQPVLPPNRPTDEAIKAEFRRKGYPLPEETGRHCIVNIRVAVEYEDTNISKWVDLVGVLYADGRPGLFYYGATGPGKRSIDKYKHGKGCTRLLPGHYPKFYGFHFHGHKRDHPALGQREIGNYEKYYAGKGWVGIGRDRIRYLNMHRTKKSRVSIPKNRGAYTEGCKLIAYWLAHWAVMESLAFPDASLVKWVASKYAASGETYSFVRKEDERKRFDCVVIIAKEAGFTIG